MPWDFGAGVAAAAGAGAGLMADSIKRERDLQGVTDLEALKQKIEQDKQARIAAIVAGVSRTKTVGVDDESGGHAAAQPKTEGEYSRAVGDALTQKGLINESGKFYERADRSDDRHELRTTQAAAQKSADEKWRVTEARQDKLLDETLRHNKAMEAKAGAERISPAARAQLEMASTYVNSAHRAESEAAKTLDAVRKNTMATPEQVTQAETEYKSSKAAVQSALKQYDEIGAAHFGDKWKKATDVAPAVTGDVKSDVYEEAKAALATGKITLAEVNKRLASRGLAPLPADASDSKSARPATAATAAPAKPYVPRTPEETRLSMQGGATAADRIGGIINGIRGIREKTGADKY